MSATMVEKHVRIRIYFENALQAPTWLLVDHESIYTIQDLENEIRRRFLGNNNSIVLLLDDCVLPKSEKTVILRDNDRVVVRECDHHKIPPDPSLSSVKEKRTVSHNFNNTEKTKEIEPIVRAQDESKKKDKKKESKLYLCQSEEKKKKKKKERVASPDFVNAEQKTKKMKKKRKLDKCEKSHESQQSAISSHINIHNQIKETEGSELLVFACSTKQDQSLDNPDKERAELDSGKTLKKGKQRKRSRDSVSSAVTTVSQKSSIDTGGNEANSVPHGNRKRKDSLKSLTGNEIGNNEGDSEEERGVKKRRRRRRKNKNTAEAEASGASNKNNSSFDNKLQKQFHPKPARNVINIYGTKNNHKVFNESESEEETPAVQESVNGMEDDNIPGEEKQESLEQAKKRLLEKVQQEYHSLTDNRDTVDRHQPINEPLSENVQVQTPYNSVQQFSSTELIHENGQLQQHEDVQVNTGMSQVQLQLVKLANGVPVYTRQRQKRYFNAFHGKELSKEQQLNTSLTNKSIIITNDQPTAIQEPDKANCESKSEGSLPPPVQDYTKFPPLQGTPRQGDKIAYKILELSDSYTPEVSYYKEAVVLNFDHNSQMIEIETKPGGPDSKPQGKFHLDDDDDHLHIEPKLSLQWESLMETRLLDIV
ncbi:coilin-like [Pecten maximus]|uniref:coilin-like n=1 Tax=Pecten maximus TaxID=6579 RepID=UPI001458826F|nr:coilin-like [Pecten maximus]